MTAKQLTDSILQMAIQGKLVPQDPNDEPAKCLLEDIRAEKQKLVEEGVLKKKDLVETPVEDDEVPFNIPESWTWIRFGDLVFTSTGKTPARGEVVYWSSNDYPWVSISDMKQGEVVNSTKEFISKKAANDCFHNEISKKGTLIMSFKLTVGRTSILGMDAFHNEAIISIKTYADNDNYTRDYLAYILPIIANSGDSKDAIKGKTLNSKSIYNLLVPLPPLAEQRRIVERIEEYLPVIKEYGEAYDEAAKMDTELPDKLKKSILQEAIMGKLGTQDPSDAPASCLLNDIRAEKQKLVEEGVLKKKDLVETPVEDDEVPFNIPKGWEWIRFGDLVATSTGKTPARGEVVYWSSNDYPWVSISDMKQGEVVNSTKEFISKKAANDCFHNEISKKGTLIMSFKLTVGRTSILGMNAYHNEAIISIKTYADNDNYTRDYLAYILPIIANSGDSKDAIKGKTLNSKSIYNLLVPLPPLAEQHRIVQKIEELYVEIDNMTVENNININEIEVTDND